ncbi:hypothetical protein [Bradyrhizobium genosp. P]|uniref:hypothetical protein n=1 Tax=Bradyrhizobium genosp. P TaxID=83641 RepID=UPI003CF3F69F
MPFMAVHDVCSHGDLHLKNIFVRQSGEVVLIDFLRSGIAPASRDPAELECAIAFDPDAGPGLDPNSAGALYRTAADPKGHAAVRQSTCRCGLPGQTSDGRNCQRDRISNRGRCPSPLVGEEKFGGLLASGRADPQC